LEKDFAERGAGCWKRKTTKEKKQTKKRITNGS